MDAALATCERGDGRAGRRKEEEEEEEEGLKVARGRLDGEKKLEGHFYSCSR